MDIDFTAGSGVFLPNRTSSVLSAPIVKNQAHIPQEFSFLACLAAAPGWLPGNVPSSGTDSERSGPERALLMKTVAVATIL